uniref:Secreted protein n=1 Tax=Eutreptiella gymnastica TaxID=73025 RepID=A0A7S1NDW0_9EUGL
MGFGRVWVLVGAGAAAAQSSPMGPHQASRFGWRAAPGRRRGAIDEVTQRAAPWGITRQPHNTATCGEPMSEGVGSQGVHCQCGVHNTDPCSSLRAIRTPFAAKVRHLLLRVAMRSILWGRLSRVPNTPTARTRSV